MRAAINIPGDVPSNNKVLSGGVSMEKQPAFPGAEGFGRYVTGGRGGRVYHVTNLNDSGTGSLRWALSQPGIKTIVFDVSGTIHLSSALNIGGNVTIAGQTAPGDGICVADYPCSIKGSNVIVRYMRFRLGNKNVLLDGADGWDGFGGFDQEDLIIDHCSISWSIDECLSVLGNKNTTVQWCLVAQSLVNSGHSKGAHGYGGNWGGSGASFHHNLLAHHTSRTPRLGPRPTTQLDERMDMRNNVIYNFGGNGCYGGEGMKVNIVNNYYKPGPGTPTSYKGKRIAGIGIRTNNYVEQYPDYEPALHIWGKYFVEGNVNSKYSDVTNDNWTYGMYNQINANDCDGTYTQRTKDTIRINQPIPFITTTTHTAEDAYQRVLDYAGASLSRDSFDQLMVSDTRNGTASFTGNGLSQGFINSQDDNKPSGASSSWSAWPTLESTTVPTDTDGDGMPDSWEDAHGLNKNDASDGASTGEDGYTNLENYLNSIVASITEAQNEGGTAAGNTEEIDNNQPSEYEISVATSNGDWTFNNGFSITTSKSYSSVSNSNYIKYSRGVKYTINIPDGISIEKVTITGNLNQDTGTGYLAELNGKTYSANDYVFPNRMANDDRSYTIILSNPATNTLTFTPGGDGQA
ncbi:MAG: pectate lyase [Prevotella sp.]|nr:pectate lyase [Prevotella sp.]